MEELIDFGDDEVSQDKLNYLSELLERTTYSEEDKDIQRYLIYEVKRMHQFEYLLNRFKMNEIQDKDRIAFGFPYNQSDIKKALKNKE